MACGCEGAKCRLEPGDDRHGALTGYNNHGCRCDACRDRKKAYQVSRSEETAAYGRVYRAVRRDEIRAWQQAYYRENAETLRAESRGRYWRNRDARLARYQRNREENIATAREWAVAHPERKREIDALHRARKANVAIGPAFTRQQVWDRDNGTCYLCGGRADPEDWHMDHVVPLARGGAHSFGNAAVSCPPCNLRKGTRLLDELDTARMMDTVSN